ncbi:hypothetical protein GQ607_015310 [Colletotrichum asianum]|uniref:Uncharacterized protein n=1 Tax=Colletotrichum asianum TaxID=702518 RepID=A0A8H3W077_9PEZI|nr:hypothetical protein GQ607_015310 [Colletotrichum asianum]
MGKFAPVCLPGLGLRAGLVSLRLRYRPARTPEYRLHECWPLRSRGLNAIPQTRLSHLRSRAFQFSPPPLPSPPAHRRRSRCGYRRPGRVLSTRITVHSICKPDNQALRTRNRDQYSLWHDEAPQVGPKH